MQLECHMMGAARRLGVVVLMVLAASRAEAAARFLIGGWVGPHQTISEYERYARAGFNVVLEYPFEGDRLERCLELASQTGKLAVIANLGHRYLTGRLSDEKSKDAAIRFVRAQRERPELVGYMVYDEPRSLEEARRVGDVAAAVGLVDRERIRWINLLGGLGMEVGREVEMRAPGVVMSTTNVHPVRSHEVLWKDFLLSLGRLRRIVPGSAEDVKSNETVGIGY